MRLHACKRWMTGFTLIELLIVVGIIAVLVAFLLPVCLNAQAASHQSTCAANLRQIGAAMSQYVSDYDGRYPPSTTARYATTQNIGNTHIFEPVGDRQPWSELLLPYVKTFPRCPLVECKKNCSQPGSAGYTLNENMSEWKFDTPATHTAEGKHEAALTAPALIVLAFDGRAQCVGLDHPDELVVNGTTFTFAGSMAEGATRHRGGANYLFADNHVKWYRPRQLSTDKQNDGKTPGFGL